MQRISHTEHWLFLTEIALAKDNICGFSSTRRTVCDARQQAVLLTLAYMMVPDRGLTWMLNNQTIKRFALTHL
jgi:hypothetical protein